ncbi:MAG TPA: aminoglycoside phosphotransferase family protein [Candidatus Desulfaltia sp.]|nr:aminoglycoside phosphotransferase family protein [Candidatus Desulfaltia sp.]
MTEHALKQVFSQFAIPGDFVRAQFLKVGHINDTYRVDALNGTTREQFIFQRINHFVFRDPERLMANFEKITRHIRAKLENIRGRNPDRETLNLLYSRSGRCFYVSPEGDYWRAYRFVGNVYIINVATRPEEAFEAGRAFGCFQKLLSDLEASSLHETIPFFHHTPRRFARFKEVLAKDVCGRASEAREAIAFALEREPMTAVITDALADDRLPLRITHNDTKINNVLFDDGTAKAVCVIDLDTTMPGSSLYDFGDMARTTTSFASEDERDLAKVRLDMEMFRALADGYLAEAGDFLTPEEIGLLVFSGRLITYTIGLRFLTDFLEGDVYFRVHRPGQNLDRARAQFSLVRSMEAQEQAMEQCVRDLQGKTGRPSSRCRR